MPRYVPIQDMETQADLSDTDYVPVSDGETSFAVQASKFKAYSTDRAEAAATAAEAAQAAAEAAAAHLVVDTTLSVSGAAADAMTVGVKLKDYLNLNTGSTRVPAGADLDNYTTAGSYWISTSDFNSILNAPTDTLVGASTIRLFVLKLANNATAQFLLCLTRLDSVYFASRAKGSASPAWSSWSLGADTVVPFPSSYFSQDDGFFSFLNSAPYGSYYLNITNNIVQLLPEACRRTGLAIIEKRHITDVRDEVYVYLFDEQNSPTVVCAMSASDKTFDTSVWVYQYGSYAISLVAGDDLDSVVSPGVYICDSYQTASQISNTPLYRAYRLEVIKLTRLSRIMQICIPITVNQIFTRCGDADALGTWTFDSWRRISTLADIVDIGQGGTSARSRDGAVYRAELQSSLVRSCKHIAVRSLDFKDQATTYYNSYDGPESKHIWDRMANCSIFTGDVYNLQGYDALYPSHSYGDAIHGDGDAYDVMVQEDERTLALIQARKGTLIDYGDIEPGDLFFVSNSPHEINNIIHVGMCLGNGYMIEFSRALVGPSVLFLLDTYPQSAVKHYCSYPEYNRNRYEFEAIDGRVLLTIRGRTREVLDEREWDEDTYQSEMYSNLPTIDNPCAMLSTGYGGHIELTVNDEPCDIPVSFELYGIGDISDSIEFRSGSYRRVQRIVRRVLSSSDAIVRDTVGSNTVFVFSDITIPDETIFHIADNFGLRQRYSDIQTVSDCVGPFRMPSGNGYCLAYSAGASSMSLSDFKEKLDANTLVVYYKAEVETVSALPAETQTAIANLPIVPGKNTVDVESTPACMLEIRYTDSESGSLFLDMAIDKSKAKIGTTSERPDNVKNGYLYYNLTTRTLQIYNGGEWSDI